MRLSLVVLIALFFIVQIGGLVWYFQDELRESRVDMVEMGLIDAGAETNARISLPGGPITENDDPGLGENLLQGELVLPEGVVPMAVEVIAHQRPLTPDQVLNSHHRRPRWRTNIDDNGRFRFSTLEPGSYVVVAQSREFHSATIVHLDAQRVHPTVVLTLKESQRFRGRTLNPTGAPLARATVYPLPAELREDAPATWPYAWQPAESDLSGFFNFAHLPEEPLRFLVVHPNFAAYLTPVMENFDEDLDISLDDGLDASLMLQNPRGNITRTKVRLTELELGVESHAAHSGPGGVVTFSKLRPARYRVTVESDRYALKEGAFEIEVHATQPQTREVAVIRGGTIRGQVLSQVTGTGMQGVTVELHGPHGPEHLTVNTDRGGYYRFAGLTPGSYRVVLRPGPALLVDGLGEDEVEVHRNDRSQGPTFILKPGIPVGGVVKNMEGAPVAHAEVFLNLSGSDVIDRTVRSNAQGAFAFEGISEDATLRIWARADQQISPAFGPTSPGPDGLPNIVLSIEHGTTGIIRGEVLDAHDAPVARAVIVLEGPEKVLPTPRETETDAWGGFRFEGLAPGAYRIRLESGENEHGAALVESVSLEDGETVVVDLRMP